jgi:hypothetical protein
VLRANLSIARSQVINNTAHRNGGAVQVDSSRDNKGNPILSHLWLTNVTMRGNEAEANGGGWFTAAVLAVTLLPNLPPSLPL